METVEEKILGYPHCSEEEQKEIEAFVESNPEWARLLQDVRVLETLVSSAPLEPGTGLEACVATYVVVTHVHPDAVPPALDRVFAQLEARLQEHGALRERVESMRGRLEAVEAEVDPPTQFEELSGYSLSPTSEEGGRANEEVQTTSASGPASLGAFLTKPFRGLPFAVRWAGAAVIFLVGTYGGLYGISMASQSTLDRLATVDVSDRVVESYSTTRTRSPVPSADTVSAQARYLEALSTLREARTSTLGLFPRYDADAVARARELLTDVVEQEDAGSFLALEARFYLGKVHLAQGHIESARSNFRTVVERGGRQAEEARDILLRLQTDVEQGSQKSGR